MKTITLGNDEILVLKTISKDFTTDMEPFHWPKEVGVKVIAQDWIPNYKYKNGIIGLPWGVGRFDVVLNSQYLLLRVKTTEDNYRYGEEDLIEICKFKECVIEVIDTRENCINILQQYAPKNAPINWLTQRNNNYFQIAGHFAYQENYTNCEGIQNAKDRSIQIRGHYGKQISGDRSHQICKDFCVQITKYDSIQECGNYCRQTAEIGTVQVTKWYGSYLYDIKTNTRIITDVEANKEYLTRNGIWELVLK